MKKQPILPLLPIVGKMPFWGFLVVTLLMVSLLGAINFVSKHVINSYVNDQLRQIHWDQVVYQFYDLPSHHVIRTQVSATPAVERVETLAWLRLRLTSQTLTELSGGSPVFVPWVTIVSSSDLDALPPALRQEGTLAVIGSQELLESAKGNIRIQYRPGQDRVDGQAVELLNRTFDRVVQVDRRDVIQWIMREVGSTTFVGQQGLILVLPFAEFSTELDRLTVALKQINDWGGDEDEEGGARFAYTPEVAHLVRFDRSQLVAGWDLDESRARVVDTVKQVHRVAEAHSFRSVTNSDLLLTVGKLAANQRYVMLVSVLLSSPILVMLWVFAGNLASLVVLNSKRTMGLLRVRGVSSVPLRWAIVLAIGAGGLLGGIVGIGVGTLVPGAAYQLAGEDVAWDKLGRIQEPWFLIAVVVIGTVFAMASGHKVTGYCTRVTPRDAAARVSASEASEFALRWGWWQAAAMAVGGYKVVAWIVNYTPPNGVLLRVDRLLDLIGAPLFVYGITALIVSRSRVTRALFVALAGPIAGAFRWFVVSNMMMRRHRTSSVMLIAALMFAITLYPQVTADSFYEKLLRGVRLNTGANVAVILDSAALLGGDVKTEALRTQLNRLTPKAAEVTEAIGRVAGVEAVSTIYEMQIPGDYYLPGGMTNLPLYIVADRDAYLKTAHHEEHVGIGRSFTEVVGGTGHGVVISKGLAAFERISAGDPIVVGHGEAGVVKDAVAGQVALLPGAPQVMLQTRESFVGAEIDFVNLLGRVNPFIVGSLARDELWSVTASPSRVVVLVDSTASADVDEVKRGITSSLDARNIQPIEIKSVREEELRLGKDMFASLGLENMRIYLIGGIAVALAGILAISLANYWQMRWTLGLLRVRGGKPRQLARIIVAEFFIPIVFGMVIGITTGIVTGYGMTNQMFKVPQTLSALDVLPVHLTLTRGAFVVAPILGLFFFGTAIAFSTMVFRRTAREGLRE